MAPAVEVRGDFSADRVRKAARASSDAGQCRRLLAIAAILDGGSRSEAAKIGGVGLQTVRDWVLRFNAEGPPALIDRKAPGKPPKLGAAQQAALVEIVEAGDRSQRCTAWCGGGLRIWCNGHGRSSASRWTRRPWAACLRGSASATFPPGHDTTPRIPASWKLLKKLSRAPGRDQSQAPGRHTHRGVVSR